jgi:hypothetical protein
MAARPPVTEADLPCAKAANLLSTKCRPGGGAPSAFCSAWLDFAESQCAGQPCERQLCHWMGQCLTGRCASEQPLPPQLYGTDHVCSFLATTAGNQPYLAYRTASQCPLEWQGAPLFEDIPVPAGAGEQIIATLSGPKGLRAPSLG